MILKKFLYLFGNGNLPIDKVHSPKTTFDFLGFEFRWGFNYWGKPVLKRRTSRNKLRVSIANFKIWFRKYSGLPKKILFAKLNRKLLGYYNYYGVNGNCRSLNSFVYQVTELLFKWLIRRSQRKSYNWERFKELIKYFGIAKPPTDHALQESRIKKSLCACKASGFEKLR